jgi:hypothetical protein
MYLHLLSLNNFIFKLTIFSYHLLKYLLVIDSEVVEDVKLVLFMAKPQLYNTGSQHSKKYRSKDKS